MFFVFQFKLERLQQNKLGVTLLQKSLKLVQVGDTIVLQAINVFGEIITKHVVLNVLSNVLSNVSLLNKQVFVKGVLFLCLFYVLFITCFAKLCFYICFYTCF